MKESTRKIAVYFIIEILYTLLIGGYFFYIRSQFLSDTAYSIPLFNIIIIGLIIIIWSIGPMLNRYIVLIYTYLYGIYAISQNIYFRAFYAYYRFNTVTSLFNEAFKAKDSVKEFIELKDIILLLYPLIITIIFVVVYFCFQRRCFKLRYRIPCKLAFLTLFILINSNWSTYQALLDDALHQEDLFQLNKTDYYIYETIPNTNQFVAKFGLLPLGLRDAISLYETDIIGESQKEEVKDFLNQRPIHQPNQMTGIFKGKNVIFIQAESFIDAALDEKLTPTLYKMKNEGIFIEGFNTPATPGSTSDTEFMTNTSIIPNSEGYAICYKYPYNSYKTTLSSIFNDEGYQTMAYHNNYGQYYNRDVVFENLGYQNFMDCTDLGLDDEQADSTIMDIIKWIYVETNKPYMAYWVSYSGHQPYNLNSVGVSQKDVDKILNLYPNLDETYVSYLAKNMDLDRAIEGFIKELKKVNKLDDVVFVFFGDHIVKGLDFNDSSFYEKTNQSYHESKTYTDLIIYNSQKEAMKYSKVASCLDILPTIANLWDIDIDYQTILGRDIFDENYDGFYYSIWGYLKSDHYLYDYINDSFSYLNDMELDEAYRQAHNYLEMVEVSKKILKLDYFKEFTYETKEND